MPQILTPQYTSATLQVYYCRLWCELRVTKKKGIAINYLFIPIYTNCTNTQQQKKKKKEKEKEHYHDINTVIKEMILFF